MKEVRIMLNAVEMERLTQIKERLSLKTNASVVRRLLLKKHFYGMSKEMVSMLFYSESLVSQYETIAKSDYSKEEMKLELLDLNTALANLKRSVGRFNMGSYSSDDF